MIRFIKRIFIIFLMLYLNTFSQEKVKVTIEVNTTGLNENEKIFITGNDSLLGNWNASSIQLEPLDKNRWEKVFYFGKGEIIEFKFTRGSWDNEAVNKDGTIPSNNSLLIEKDTTLTLNIGFWKDQFEYETGKDIMGEVEYLRNLKGIEIKPRDVIIWLPPGYNTDTTDTYPVLYMHDGQNIFDPSTSFLGAEWRLDEIADSLISKGLIEKIIIVGIYNTESRNEEYNHTDSGYAYMRFIINELKPMIDSLYRTKPGRENTATGGSSSAGLISFMLAWEYPEIFSKVISVSPAFHIDDINYIPFVEKEEKKPIKIYIDNGGIGLEKRLQPGVDEMISLLLSKGYEYGKDLQWYFDKKGEHNENSWSKRFWRALTFLFGK